MVDSADIHAVGQRGTAAFGRMLRWLLLLFVADTNAFSTLPPPTSKIPNPCYPPGAPVDPSPDCKARRPDS